jgi:hypothetical protein
MKLSEFIKMLEEDFDKWKDAEVHISVKGRYDWHHVIPKNVVYVNGDEVVIWSEYVKMPDEVTRGEQWSKAVRLIVEFPVWEEDIDDLKKFTTFTETCEYDCLCKFAIDLKSHKIVSWDSKVGVAG